MALQNPDSTIFKSRAGRFVSINKDELIAAIGRGLAQYHLWTIGITTNPARRKEEHEQDGKKVESWHEWKADSLSVAQNVEKHFLGKGMKGGEGGDIDDSKTVYVYIF